MHFPSPHLNSSSLHSTEVVEAVELEEVEEVEEVGGNDSTTSTINIYWPRLVLRPACVDTLIISTQGKTYHITIIRSNSDGDVFLTYVYQVFSYINRKLHQKCNIHTTYLSRSEDWDITTNNY